MAVPAVAASVYQAKTAPVDMKEPVITTQLTEPKVPNPLWPGTELTWAFLVENISPRDYWIQVYVQVQAQGETGAMERGFISGVGPGGSFKTDYSPGQPFLLPAKTTYGVNITAIVDEASPVAMGVTFTLYVNRVHPPSGEKG